MPENKSHENRQTASLLAAATTTELFQQAKITESIIFVSATTVIPLIIMQVKNTSLKTIISYL